MKATRGIIWIGVMGLATLAAGPARAEAPSKADRDAVAKLAEKIKTSFNTKDWPGLISTMPPNIVADAGGAEALLTRLKQEMAKIEERGMTMEGMALAPEDAIHRGSTHRIVFMKTKMTIKFGDRTVRADSFQIAMAKLGEDRWYAIDGSQVTDKVFRSMFKDMPADLKLPKIVQTVE